MLNVDIRHHNSIQIPENHKQHDMSPLIFDSANTSAYSNCLTVSLNPVIIVLTIISESANVLSPVKKKKKNSLLVFILLLWF